LADVEAKQAAVEGELEHVRKVIASKVDPPKEPELDPTDRHPLPKKDISEYKKNLAKIEKEEEEKEEFIEAQKAK